MSAANPLVKEITNYLDYLDTDQQKAVLSVVKNFTKDEYIWWEDKEFVRQLDKRASDLESGKVKAITPEELEHKVQAAYKKRQKKKA